MHLASAVSSTACGFATSSKSYVVVTMKQLTVLAFFFLAIAAMVGIRLLIELAVDTDPNMPPADQISESVDAPPEGDRSGKWTTVRKRFIEQNPVCQACQRDHNLNVHHVVPVHVDPALELDMDNLITLCAGDDIRNSDGDKWPDYNCHFRIGHDPDGPDGPRGPNWKLSNPNVRRDAQRRRDSLELAP